MNNKVFSIYKKVLTEFYYFVKTNTKEVDELGELKERENNLKITITEDDYIHRLKNKLNTYVDKTHINIDYNEDKTKLYLSINNIKTKHVLLKKNNILITKKEKTYNGVFFDLIRKNYSVYSISGNYKRIFTNCGEDLIKNHVTKEVISIIAKELSLSDSLPIEYLLYSYLCESRGISGGGIVNLAYFYYKIPKKEITKNKNTTLLNIYKTKYNIINDSSITKAIKFNQTSEANIKLYDLFGNDYFLKSNDKNYFNKIFLYNLHNIILNLNYNFSNLIEYIIKFEIKTYFFLNFIKYLYKLSQLGIKPKINILDFFIMFKGITFVSDILEMIEKDFIRFVIKLYNQELIKLIEKYLNIELNCFYNLLDDNNDLFGLDDDDIIINNNSLVITKGEIYTINEYGTYDCNLDKPTKLQKKIKQLYDDPKKFNLFEVKYIFPAEYFILLNDDLKNIVEPI